jgi:hypothetical protein
MRLDPACLAASALAFITACSSGTAPGARGPAGVVAADDPLVVPPGLTERPASLDDSIDGETADHRAPATR